MFLKKKVVTDLWALAIISNADQLRAHTSDFFPTHNLDPEQGVSALAHRLRHVVVNEWQSNPQDYEGFVGCGVDVIVEAEKFKQDGIFLGELGNTVLCCRDAAHAVHMHQMFDVADRRKPLQQMNRTEAFGSRKVGNHTVLFASMQQPLTN